MPAHELEATIPHLLLQHTAPSPALLKDFFQQYKKWPRPPSQGTHSSHPLQTISHGQREKMSNFGAH